MARKFDTTSIIKYWGNDNPVCPYCDELIDIGEYDLFHLYEEGEHEIDCPNCEKEVRVYTRVKYSFDTDEQ